jgi:SAM-dependent methyltransferase
VPGPPISLEDCYDAFPRIEAAFQEMLGETLDPRGPELLDELVRGLNLPPGATVVDVGCGEGHTTIELARRFGFDVHGVDPVERHLELGRAARRGQQDAELAARLRFSRGRAEHLPVDDASVDLVWCCEVLMYADLDESFAEIRRVLRAGGHVLVHQVLTGPRMGDDEAEAFWRDLGAPAASVRPDDVDAAASQAGLVVDERIELGSEWGERAEERSGAGTRRLLHTARLLRDPDRYVQRFGRTAYRIMLGDCLWHVHRMTGRLTGCAWVLTNPNR